jgi:hypothetical protein
MNVYRSHVPVPKRLQLPASLAYAQTYVSAYDPDLRLRKSAENPNVYILERRCRRRPATNTAMRDGSDMHVQARDGYIHVASVCQELLFRPNVIIDELATGGRDEWAEGGAEKVFDELVYEQAWAKETRRRRRMRRLRDVTLEGFDLLNRSAGSRISNAGGSASAAAAA